MKRFIARLLVVGGLGVLMVVGAFAAYGQGSVQTYLPLMARYHPFPPNPPLTGYLGLTYSNTDGDYDLYTVRADGSEWTNITNNTVDDNLVTWAWSDDGTHLFYQNSTGAWLHNLRTNTPTRLGPARYYQGLFSPNSQYLLLLAQEEPPTSDYIHILTVVDIETGAMTSYTTSSEVALAPEWSPTSNAFGFRTVRFGGNAQALLWIVSVGAETPQQVALTLSDTKFIWSNNGQWLMFTEDTSTETEPSGRAAYTTLDGTIQVIAEDYTGESWLADQQVLLAKDEQLFTATLDGSTITLFSDDLPFASFAGEISPNRQQVIFYSLGVTYYRTLTSDHAVGLDPSCPTFYKQCYEYHLWAPNNRGFITQYIASGHIGEVGWIYNDVTVDPPTATRLGFGLGDFLPLSSRYVWFNNEPPSLLAEGSNSRITNVETQESYTVPLPGDNGYMLAWRYMP